MPRNACRSLMTSCNAGEASLTASAIAYIHLYHGNAALLTESLEVIQKTSAVILSALEIPITDEATAEPEPGGQPQDN